MQDKEIKLISVLQCCDTAGTMKKNEALSEQAPKCCGFIDFI